ncbi:MAG TPA: HlyD family efflux transporter periplasmic adaptor subunit [Gemmatimonadaceae bacterium]
MNRHIAIGLLAAAACTQPDPMRASGTIEFTQTDIAAMVPARVVRILVDEGATVRAGDTIAVLSQTGLPEDIDQRRARLAAAEAELRDLQRGARPQEIDRAQADLRSAQAEATRTAADSARLARLLTAGGISQSAFDAAASAARVAGARRDAASEAVQLLEAGARPERIAAAGAAVATARAQLAMGQAAAGDLVLTAPGDGQVMARHAEAGEVLAAGIPLVSLGDARRAWVRVYVPSTVFSTILPGQRVTLTVDGLAGRSFEARVAALATEAEFTPRVALTETERADLLFGVKLELSDTTGTLKAGLPATANFGAVGGRGTAGRKSSQP